MAAYVPDLADLTGFGGFAVAMLLFLGLGSFGARGALPAEVRIIAGWGVACLALTVWGVATPLSLRIPLGLLGIVGVGLLLHRFRQRDVDAGSLARIAVLSVPFWLVLLPAQPTQVDTWLNLLPNAAYLYDHGMLPRHDRPPSWSFLPVAPYNTQFASFAASVIAGHLVPNALALFNLALLIPAGLLFARLLAGGPSRIPPWWALACGLALAIPLNPGFVPRTFLSGYGETPLAVAALFAVWLAAGLQRRLAVREPVANHVLALALTLAALVNTKQSGIGLVLPIGLSFLGLAATNPSIGARRGLTVTVASLAPALGLWLIWRVYAVTAFEVGELQPLPVSRWNFPLLPTILAAVLRTIVQKATFYLCLLAVFASAVIAWRRAPRSPEASLLAMIVGTTVLYNGFVLFTYIAHFPPEMARNAHSYFRYSGHLSLLVVLGLIVALRPAAERAVLRLGSWTRVARIAAVAMIAGFPLVTAPMLRFDLQAPQPALYALAPRIAAHIPDGARLAVLVPGDPYDAAGSALRGALLYLEPRRPKLDLITRNHIDQAEFDALRQAGISFAFLSCVRRDSAGLANVALTAAHVGKSALLRATDSGWAVIDSWSWPADHATERFGALLERPVFCADQPT